MAEQRPRIAWENAAANPTTTYLAQSSEQPAYPSTRLRDPNPQASWRSKLGWNIVAGVNDKIDVNRSGPGNYSITLTEGNYANGQALAAEIQAKLEAADSAPVWVVDYDNFAPNTFRFASGGFTFTLRWQNGPNAASGTGTTVGKDLGFDISADDSGATAYVADAPVFKSREWIAWDFSTWDGFDVGHDGKFRMETAVFYFHNLNADSGGTAKLQGSDSPFAGLELTPSNSYTLTGSGRIFITRPTVFNQFYRTYWRLVLDDRLDDGPGYTEVGVAGLFGSSFEPGRSWAQGEERHGVHFTPLTRSLAGGLYRAPRGRTFGERVEFRRLSRADRQVFESIEDQGVGFPFFLMRDPATYLAEETVYVALTEAISYTHSVGDGTPPERWTISMAVEQVI